MGPTLAEMLKGGRKEENWALTSLILIVRGRIGCTIVLHHLIILSYQIYLGRISPPPLSHSLSVLCTPRPFHVVVHSGHLCMNGTPRAVVAQFWGLLAGVILSHTGPLINGSIVGCSLRDWPGTLKLHQTHREKTTIIWPLSVCWRLMEKPVGESWLIDIIVHLG